MNNTINDRLFKLLSVQCIENISQDIKFLMLRYNKLISLKNIEEINKPCSLFKKNILHGKIR